MKTLNQRYTDILDGLLDLAKELHTSNLPHNLTEFIEEFILSIEKCQANIASEEGALIIMDSLLSIYINGNSIVERLCTELELPTPTQIIVDHFIKMLSTLNAKLDETQTTNKYSTEKQEKESTVNALQFQSYEIDKFKYQLTSQLKQLDNLNTALASFSEKMELKIKWVDAIYLENESNLKQKQKDIDDLIGKMAESVMAGDYERSAGNEKYAADLLRIGSLGIMITITIIIFYSIWETMTVSPKLEILALRIIMTFLLSAPAIYLARESAKHRQQQYYYQQKSLDLKSITPYIASLPEDMQHKIKSEIAARLFASTTPTNADKDSYPLNIQEILIEFIKKYESTKK